jgi:ATP-dependent DNA helicase 2 subunit 2
MVQLPTTEDLRDYQFPSLVASTNKQRIAASNFIDSLDLAEPEEEERVNPKETFNPALQYFAQVVTDKVTKGESTGKT